MKRIFITGAASGIGRETARRFASEGWFVGISDRDPAALDALAQELGDSASAHVADVTDYAGLASAFADFCGDGGLDAIFNNAGILEMRYFEQTSIQRLNDVVNVNINGVINGAHAAIPYLRKAEGSKLINMGSVAGVYGIPEEAVYSGSKFFVRGMTESINIELEPEGIWACDVMVAYVATPMVQEAERQAASVGILGVNVTPDQVADTVWKAANGRQVHWFVTEADFGVAQQVDSMPWEERRNFVKEITGF